MKLFKMSDLKMKLLKYLSPLVALVFMCCLGNAAESVDQLRARAERGEAEAQSSLGVMYGRGEGVPKDIAESLKWIRKAADQGDARAQNNLGSAYARGEGVEQDYDEAFDWYRKAALQGNAAGQN